MHVADTCITFNHVFDSQGEHNILNSPHPPGIKAMTLPLLGETTVKLV